MELALYCPVYGYYEKETDNPGRSGDYFTSVSVGELFGELLAFQFADWLGEIRHPDSALWIAESGAHDGRLANDILTWLRGNRTALFQRVQYLLVEPSALRQRRQRANLAGFGEKARWLASWEEWPRRQVDGGLRGIVFSNELFDALPVHRLGWDARSRSWFEWGVRLQNGKFDPARIRTSLAEARGPKLPDELSDHIPDEFTIEICPAAENLWSAAAGVLEQGRMLTIDYGLTSEERFAPERKDGTLRGYYRHHLAPDPLANAGEQDLTAHVNFSALQAAGESAGLRTDALLAQETFLAQIVGKMAERPSESMQWSPARARQFQTLTHPGHIGRAFRVLIQSRQPPFAG